MMDTKFLPVGWEQQIAGTVSGYFVKDHGEWLLQWTCPFCHDIMTINAVEFMVNFSIEDARTGFAHCSGADYRIIAPKKLPPKVLSEWQKSANVF